jgi:hypothetical protein
MNDMGTTMPSSPLQALHRMGTGQVAG